MLFLRWQVLVVLEDDGGTVVVLEAETLIRSALGFGLGVHAERVEGGFQHVPRGAVHVALFVVELLEGGGVVVVAPGCDGGV